MLLQPLPVLPAHNDKHQATACIFISTMASCLRSFRSNGWITNIQNHAVLHDCGDRSKRASVSNEI